MLRVKNYISLLGKFTFSQFNSILKKKNTLK